MNYEVFESFPDLHSERLSLLNYEIKDAKDLFELQTDPEVMAFMDRPMPKNFTEVQNKIKEIQKDFESKKGVNWTIRLKDQREVIGYIGFWNIDHKNHRVEIGYTLKKEHWNKGLATEAARIVIDFAFDKLQAHSICANINPDNRASRALLTKLGFRQEAYFREDYFYDGKFLDSAIFGLLESDWR